MRGNRTMRTVIILPMKKEITIPQKFQGDDVRFPESLARYFVEKFTEPRSVVLDPFAGFGTTLFVAESMDRIPFGIELDLDRFQFIQKNMRDAKHIIHGDARRIDEYDFPQVDLVLTSPPYMRHMDESDPLTAYTDKGDYEKYLDGIQNIFHKLKRFLSPNSNVIVEVSNLKGDEVTTLAWDVARSISNVLHFEGEIIVAWEGADEGDGIYGYGYDHSYCLMFKKQ